MLEERTTAIFQCLWLHPYGITAKDMAAKIGAKADTTSSQLSKLAQRNMITREKIPGHQNQEYLYKPKPKTAARTKPAPVI